MSLQERLDSEKQLSLDLGLEIQDLEAQIKEKKLQKDKVITKATNIAKIMERVNGLAGELKEILSNASGVFGEEDAIDDITDVFTAVGEEIKSDFEAHKNKADNPYLEQQQTGDRVSESIEHSPQQLTIVASDEMPEPDDNETPLTIKNAKELINGLDKTELQIMSLKFGWGNLSSINSVAKAIAKDKVTRYELENYLNKYLERSLLAG